MLHGCSKLRGVRKWACGHFYLPRNLVANQPPSFVHRTVFKFPQAELTRKGCMTQILSSEAASFRNSRSCTTDVGTRCSIRKIPIAVGGTLKIHLLGVNVPINVSTGENFEEIQLKAWWNPGLGIMDENPFEVLSVDNIVSMKLNQCHETITQSFSQLGVIIPGRWCNLFLEAGLHCVDIKNLKEASLEVKTTGGDIALGELRGSMASIESHGGSFTAGVVSAVSEVNTEGGNISVAKALGTKITMDTMGGDVVIDSLYGDDVRLSSKGGQIEIKHLQAQNLAHISSEGGNINIGGIDGNIKILSGGGVVQLQLLNNAKEVEVDSGGREMTIYISSNLDAEVEHLGERKLIQCEEKIYKIPCCKQEELESRMNSLPGRLHTCRVRILGSGNLTVRRRNWLEAVMSKII